MSESFIAEAGRPASLTGVDRAVAADRAFAAADLACEIVDSREGFLALRDDWDALFERSGKSHQLFQSFDWLRHWCRHYVWPDGTSRRCPLRIVVGRADGRVTVIWPLLLDHVFGMRRIGWMGEPVSQYGDVLVEDGPHKFAHLEESWRFLRQTLEPDLMVLRKVREDGEVAALLRKLDADVACREQAPYADLTDHRTFEDYEARFSKKQRRNRRRQWNRLSEVGPLGFEILESGEAARQAVKDATAMKRRWLRENGLISPAFADERLDAFFADVATARDRPSGCLVSVLKLGDRPVALEIGLLCKERYVAHIGAFDLEHAKLSPGALQMQETLRHCIEKRGVVYFDLLAPSSGYKRGWAESAVQVSDFVVPMGAGGHLYANLYLKRIRPGLKDALARLPAFATRLLPRA